MAQNVIEIQFTGGPGGASPTPPTPSGLGGPAPITGQPVVPGGGFGSPGFGSADLFSRLTLGPVSAAARARWQAEAAALGKQLNDTYKKITEDTTQRIAAVVTVGARIISDSFTFAAQQIALAGQRSA